MAPGRWKGGGGGGDEVCTVGVVRTGVVVVCIVVRDVVIVQRGREVSKQTRRLMGVGSVSRRL